jgi:GntR family transcriptional regulator
MTTTEYVARNIPLPLYAQVESVLIERIQSGFWKPGDQIATESELCVMFGVSRTVVRQALDDLVQNGLLVRQRGRGTFVARERIHESWVQRLTGFHEDMDARGLQPISEVLEQRTVAAPDKIADILRLARGAEVTRIARVRSVTGSAPLLYVVTHIPTELCPGLVDEDLTGQSLYRLLENKYGLRLESGVRSLEARPASEL